MNRFVLACFAAATILLGTAASGPQARNEDLHLSAIQVAVTFDGMPTAYFRSVSGLSVELEVVEFREGGSNDVRKLPGRVKYPNIVLKQAFLGGSELQKWAFRIAAGQFEHKNASIVLSDQKSHVVLARYTLTNAWPMKWNGPDFDASSNDVAIETIEIVHEGLRLVTDP